MVPVPRRDEESSSLSDLRRDVDNLRKGQKHTKWALYAAWAGVVVAAVGATPGAWEFVHNRFFTDPAGPPFEQQVAKICETHYDEMEEARVFGDTAAMIRTSAQSLAKLEALTDDDVPDYADSAFEAYVLRKRTMLTLRKKGATSKSPKFFEQQKQARREAQSLRTAGVAICGERRARLE